MNILFTFHLFFFATWRIKRNFGELIIVEPIIMQQIEVFCRNNGQTLYVIPGSKLVDVYDTSGLNMPYGPASAKVNNVSVGLNFRIYRPMDVEFLDMFHVLGNNAETRTEHLGDGVHMSAEGRKVYADAVIRFLKELEAERVE